MKIATLDVTLRLTDSSGCILRFAFDENMWVEPFTFDGCEIFKIISANFRTRRDTIARRPSRSSVITDWADVCDCDQRFISFSVDEPGSLAE